MTTITITLTDVCAGGDHFTYGVTGAKTLTVAGNRSTTLNAVSDEEAQAFVNVIGKMAKAGRTHAQAKALLEAGVVITV